MELVPLNLRERLLQNGAEVRENDDHIPLLKLFTPDANATWLISELDPEDPDQAFALCRVQHNANYVELKIMLNAPAIFI
ncbi:DUF2958 domain-containing protein [Methylocystis sp. IM4]|uniref:DUF2958 domain-containing protein n=1 Tax=Methylocystis sp. IM4 TaxID=3136560 RepID=UPI0040535976